jgi:hypothetical protein
MVRPLAVAGPMLSERFVYGSLQVRPAASAGSSKSPIWPIEGKSGLWLPGVKSSRYVKPASEL